MMGWGSLSIIYLLYLYPHTLVIAIHIYTFTLQMYEDSQDSNTE